MTDYNALYDEFASHVEKGTADAHKAAEYLVKMSRVFSEYNTVLTGAKAKDVLKLSEISQTVDEATNKPITSSKAAAVADASEEHLKYMAAKSDVENISVFIAGIKYFQMGLAKDFGASFNG